MKRLLFFFTLMPFVVFSQNTDSTRNRKFFIGLSFSPDYSYRIIKPIPVDDPSMAQENEYNRQLVDSLNKVEKGKLAFTFGISFIYKINKRFTIRSGFYYSDKGIKSKGFVYGNGAWSGYGIFAEENYKKSIFYFYEVPLSISYSFYLDSLKKFQAYIFIGPTFCLNSHWHNYVSRRWYDVSKDYHDESSYQVLYADAGTIFRIGYTAGFGFSLKATERFNIVFEPVFKYYPYPHSPKKANIPNSSQLPVTILNISERPFSFGCNIGFNYGF